MGRKLGALGIFLVILLYFLSGFIIARLANYLDQRFPNIPLREYILAGMLSLAGFIYWFLIAKLASKSIKKLIFGRSYILFMNDIDWDLIEDDEYLARQEEVLFRKFIEKLSELKSPEAKELSRAIDSVQEQLDLGKITYRKAISEFNKIERKISKSKISEREKECLLAKLARTRATINSIYKDEYRKYLYDQERKKKRRKKKK